jgi:hypothetical protein
LGYHNRHSPREEAAIGTRIQQPFDTLESGRGVASPNPAAVRDQLERILANPLFRNSKRYTNLLRFVVERRLDSDIDGLKERLLGIEVFGRDPDYNTTQDPVVRTSAVEVRKRLAEYYQLPGHDSEIRIELPAGCYVPEFHVPADERGMEICDAPAAPRSFRKRAVVASAVLALLVGGVLWWEGWSRSAIDRFWAPVAGSPAPILFSVMGSPAQAEASATTLSDIFRSGQNAVPLPDVTALVNIAGFLKRSGKIQRIEISRNIQFQDLKAGPSVIIGPVTPRWKELLSSGWRFSVERDPDVTVTWIRDRERPDSRQWSVEVNAPSNSTAEAYALVTRVWNETLGQPVVSVAGLSPYGTTAAGEFLSDAAALDRFASQAPRGWDRRNIQLVIGAMRVGTTSGRPRVLASYFW